MTRTTVGADLRIGTSTSFEDPAVGAERWDRLLAGGTDVVFLTRAWQRLWWHAMDERALMIVLAERDGRPFALAPLYAANGTLLLVGSGSADYLDVVGRPDEAALAAMLERARDALPEFSGIELYHLPADSPTGALLPGVAARLGLELHSEEEMGAPYADLTDAEIVTRLTSRRSVRKEEARMRRAAPLDVRAAHAGELEELIELFLRQHGARWRAVGQDSFERPGSRELVRTVVESGLRDQWARLTVLEWRGAPAALDISLIRGTTQLSWLVSRDPSIQDYSPGRVLRGHVVRNAVDTGMRRLDFGLGEEDYKLRDASGVTRIANWFMYA
ncbi:MAG TPA: GNAT family N-acetyltransferase [Solirubrobacteraceae bacterium]|nr:GNAT family N-acetyltransferase [Solirubrobacteraceae bacterium]